MIFFSPISYWFFPALLYLVWLTWQDCRNNMLVDDRKNWFVMGLSVSLINFTSLSPFSVFFLIVCMVGLMVFFSWSKMFGQGDITAFGWMFLSFGFLDLFTLGLFMVLLLLFSSVFFVCKKFVFLREKLPFFPVLLIVFLVTAFMGGTW